jgi:hypothetical protein
MDSGLYKPAGATVRPVMEMNRSKWTLFLAVGIAIIIFDPAAALRLLEERGLRYKIGKML